MDISNTRETNEANDWVVVANATTTALVNRIGRIREQLHDALTVHQRARIERDRAAVCDSPAPADAYVALRTAIDDLRAQLDIAEREAAADAVDNDEDGSKE